MTASDIVDKYIETNIAHPFMEGNGRATRIWLDQIFKTQLGKCVDWQRIDKEDYLSAMEKSSSNAEPIEQVQKILGHSQIDTTMQYAMVNQSNVKTPHQK